MSWFLRLFLAVAALSGAIFAADPEFLRRWQKESEAAQVFVQVKPWRIKGFAALDRPLRDQAAPRVVGDEVQVPGLWRFAPELPVPGAKIGLLNLTWSGLYCWVVGGKLYRLSRQTGEPIWIASDPLGGVEYLMTDPRRPRQLGAIFSLPVVGEASALRKKAWLFQDTGEAIEVGKWVAQASEEMR